MFISHGQAKELGGLFNSQRGDSSQRVSRLTKQIANQSGTAASKSLYKHQELYTLPSDFDKCNLEDI